MIVRRTTPRIGAAIALGIAVAVAACGGASASFSAEGPCTVDGRAPRAYPHLEARLPSSLAGVSADGAAASAAGSVPPTTVDSGRNCTERVLGSLWGHGLRELRYAGATWELGGGDGVVSAVFLAAEGQPMLQTAWLEEFYEASARSSSKAENIEVTRPTVDAAGEVFRLDTLNDLSFQTVVVWPDGDIARVVIVATTVQPGADRAAHDAVVADTVRQSAGHADA